MQKHPSNSGEDIIALMKKNGEKFAREKAEREAERKTKSLFKIPRLSMQVKVAVLIGTLGFVAIGATWYVSHKSAMEAAFVTAESRGRVMFDTVASIRSHFRSHIKPTFENNRTPGAYTPVLQSGFHIVRGVHDAFTKKNQEISFKQAARNPLWPGNTADAFDLSIIEQLERLKKESTTNSVAGKPAEKLFVSGEIEKEGQRFYYYSEPFSVTSTNCLKCHGNPADAPEGQRKVYGTTSGYNWELGEIVAASVVYVQMESAYKAALKQSTQLVIIISAFVFIIAIVLWAFIKYRILNPLNNLRNRADELAINHDMEEPLSYSKDDEVGDLYKAFDNMRINIVSAIKRFGK